MLPVPPGLSIEAHGHHVVMNGPSGEHVINVRLSDPERVLVHWYGYCANNGHIIALPSRPLLEYRLYVDRPRPRPKKPLRAKRVKMKRVKKKTTKPIGRPRGTWEWRGKLRKSKP